MKVLISGGGTKVSNIVVNKYFAKLINFGTVLYIPNAGDEAIRSYKESFDYVNEMFSEVGIKQVEMYNLDEIDGELLERFDAIYLSGGSISKLVGELREAGFDELIIDFAQEKIVYGQSAGGISLGSDVTYFEEARNTKPLGLIDYAITCHYKEEHYEKVKVGTKLSTYCIRDNEAVYFHDDNIDFINGEPVFVDRSLGSNFT